MCNLIVRGGRNTEGRRLEQLSILAVIAATVLVVAVVGRRCELLTEREATGTTVRVVGQCGHNLVLLRYYEPSRHVSTYCTGLYRFWDTVVGNAAHNNIKSDTIRLWSYVRTSNVRAAWYPAISGRHTTLR